ncbi:acetylornithine deacetylase [Sagittula stellata]|uniref:Acetylornithine deacetylase n=1 Tax=Sagittula stellata (strain ATCC 700073 / DSM 11524 / E-37) TaxID=388399 RepID=A3K8M6_SAGS3|nr:acetylornithine deacetylase [Sagittula stellata]EBA06464.1 acetylornithine deacetylase [Sagittula stellata E-37]
MTPETILADLVACADLPGDSNARVADCVLGHLRRAGLDPHVMPGPEGDRVNIFASIGPRDVPGMILSGHMDVVPGEGQPWTSDPFRLTEREGKLHGRGATDMKGFLACMLAAIPNFRAARLERPLHLAFSYDEEIGCRGVGHMIAALPDLVAPPFGCIVGEPTDMRPVLSHKGKQSTRLTMTGRPAHSSRPDDGVNAIYASAEMLLAIRDLNATLASDGPFDPRFDPPHSTAVAGVVRGGTAVNIIPDHAEIDMEVRCIPGQTAADVTALVVQRLEGLTGTGAALSVSTEVLSSYPALPPAEDKALSELLERLTGHAPVQSVSFGTEAGLFYAAGIPSIVCGPGNIGRAHRPDEYILPEELGDCMAMLRGLASELAA